MPNPDYTKHTNIYNKIDAVKNDVGDVKQEVVQIKTLLEAGIIRRIETLEIKQRENIEDRKSFNKFILITIVPMLLKMIYDTLISVG